MKYILKHGTITAVVETHGGELVSLKGADGIEHIWQGDPAYWSGHNPTLFPIVGALKGGTVRIDGSTYQMGRHGFARNSEFSVLEKGEDFIVFQLLQSESTLQIFPFDFDLRIRHQLHKGGFFTQFEVYNPGTRTLPFCIGAHTAFNCPITPGARFSDHYLLFDCPENAWALTPDSSGCLSEENKLYALQNTDRLQLDHQVFADIDTLIFEGLRSQAVSLLGPDGHGVHMEFSDFPMIAFWTAGAKQAPYICLEPWHGCAAFHTESGEFTDKPHCVTLAPGQSKVLRYTVTLI